MSESEAEFLRKLEEAFRVEAGEHLQVISSGLLELEKLPDAGRREEVVASIFREAHSLKGAARAVNAAEAESVCQALEGVFAAWRKRGVRPLPETLDPMHLAVGAVERLVSEPDPSAAAGGAGIAALLDRLASLAAAADGEAHPSPAGEAGNGAGEQGAGEQGAGEQGAGEQGAVSHGTEPRGRRRARGRFVTFQTRRPAERPPGGERAREANDPR